MTAIASTLSKTRATNSAGQLNNLSALCRGFRAFTGFSLIVLLAASTSAKLSAGSSLPYADIAYTTRYASGFVSDGWASDNAATIIYQGDTIVVDAIYTVYINDVSSLYFDLYIPSAPPITYQSKSPPSGSGEGGNSASFLDEIQPTSIGSFTCYARMRTQSAPNLTTYRQLTVNVLQGPSPSGTITADTNTLSIGQTTTIRANFALPGGDSAVGSNIDINAVGSPAPGQDGSAQTSRTYTFTPTIGGIYTFYADIKTSYRNWATYGLHSSGPTAQVTITVNAPVSITSQTSSLTVASGQGASFSVSATGFPAPNYQWQISTDNKATWSNLLTNDLLYSGSTQSPTLTVAGQTSANSDHWYRCVVSNIQGSQYSVPVQLIIKTGPFDATVPTLPLWALGSLIGIVFFVVKATQLKPSRA